MVALATVAMLTYVVAVAQVMKTKLVTMVQQVTGEVERLVLTTMHTVTIQKTIALLVQAVWEHGLVTVVVNMEKTAP
jgi:hypothetical protein